MSIQEKGDVNTVNTDEKKDNWIQIRVSSNTKKQIKDFTKSLGYNSISKFILDSVMTNVNTNVLTNELDTQILKNGLLEFNKLMEFNQDILKSPKDLDFNKIREALKRCL